MMGYNIQNCVSERYLIPRLYKELPQFNNEKKKIIDRLDKELRYFPQIYIKDQKAH